MMYARWTCLSGCVLLGAACGRPSGDLVTRVDSAGVQLVENAMPDRPLDWTVRERFRLGGADDGPEAFTLVETRLIDVDSAGNIFLLDPLNHRVVTFTSGGQFRWMAGHDGDGPGEFGRPTGLSVNSGGEVFVADAADRTLSHLDANGHFVGQLPWYPTPQFEWQREGLLTMAREYAGGKVVDRLVKYVMSDTLVLDSTVGSPTRSTRFESCGFPMSSRRPLIFSKVLVWHTSGDRIVVSSEVGYGLDLFSGTSLEQLSSVRRALNSREATFDLAMDWAEANPIVISSATGECITSPREVVEVTGFAEWVPLVADVRISPDGFVWARRYAAHADSGVIDIFDESGQYRGSLPETFPWPMAFLPDGGVLFAERDAVDLEWLVVATIG